MEQIKELHEGAYYAPSYSDQTVIGYISGINTQSVITIREEIDSSELLDETEANDLSSD